MKHLMIDLETYGTVPGCGLVSIGAVFFDPTQDLSECLGAELYVVVNRASCQAAGLHEDESTLGWWSTQRAEAREAFMQATDNQGLDLPDALAQLSAFVKRETNVLIYGNGADFDKPLLSAAYRAAGLKEPWRPYNGRCHRTLKAMFPEPVKLPREGAHHALADARFQARQLVSIAQHYLLELK